MTPKELETAIRALLKQPISDAGLREQLEKLAAVETSFSGFTWLFGPELYRRNRILFRPFILSRFSTYMVLPKFRVEALPWKGDRAKGLEAWLAEVDRDDDADLFRRLYAWRLDTQHGRISSDKRSDVICRDLLARYRGAKTSGERQTVLRKFDLWFQVSQETASTLYELHPKAAGPFILGHLPRNWLGSDKRVLWSGLIALADAGRDDEFRWKLYRRQVPVADWTKDCVTLCAQVADAAALVVELEKRHIEGWQLNLADAFFQLLQRRGRDVFPYVMRHLRQVWGGWFTRGSYGKMADYAREKGWWDLWSALIRVCSGPKEFNKEVASLVEDHDVPEQQAVQRLLALVGASREWNWPGLGLATVHQLDEGVALRLYERFPGLLRGPFKLHVQPNVWGASYSKLLDRLIADREEELIDTLASRIVTRHGRWRNTPKLLEEASKLAEYYTGLKSDETAFARRAANVLSKVPAYSICQYNPLIRENRLARLLFERSARSYLADPRSLADLVEGAEIHVMALAYRALALDDDRARQQAATHLPLLLGTLLRPMQRETRTLAFGALANAAVTVDAARMILERAKDALHLPDTRYPKERLLGLIAHLLHRWPELRGANEHPLVHERRAA